MSKHSHKEAFVTPTFFLLVLVFVLVTALIITNHPEKFFSTHAPATTTEIVHLDADDPKNGFLHAEEAVVVETSSSTEVLSVDRVLFEYVEVIDGCGPHFEGECLNVRSGPGVDYPAIAKLRNGMVLKVDGKVERTYDIATTTLITLFSTSTGLISTSSVATTTAVTENWYKVVFDEWLRYPERVKGDWYVRSDFVSILQDEGDKTSWEHGNASTTKKIVVDRGEQKLYAYEGEELYMEAKISTGLALTPTPRGTFTIFKKTPSRYMQGPLPNLSDRQYYDLPGVPWNLYFTHGGAVIHGAYWHNSFGSRYSHGCVNLPPSTARDIYNWAELGTTVVVRD